VFPFNIITRPKKHSVETVIYFTANLFRTSHHQSSFTTEYISYHLQVTGFQNCATLFFGKWALELLVFFFNSYESIIFNFHPSNTCRLCFQVQFVMHIRMSQLCPDTRLPEKTLSAPRRGQLCFQPRTPEHTLSRGHPYTSLASGAGDSHSAIPGNLSSSNKHFRRMIKMEAGEGGGGEQQLL